ncbi:phosphoribosyltransferase family protein [Micromonospora endophytica]|uniref:adenine phosphoribosyltransferase n=1 Tax=Micromonospora endophytica TaxID=515350 RepID=A0A2W2DW76_9ACTN|nr:phosphoribosyltransferase family protein [Micromonospora endophytica]PZF97083.1 phosphoribosyltransferase [Micromonospora endophytica]RIW47754.1 phosphoribosyltransferase [Micromonospora endophytica]BCJ59335.1 adenine phosphoribosyltransferase [Micromonospora endophytica]
MAVELRARLIELFRWVDPGPGASHLVSDISGWWRDPMTLAALGPALVAPYRSAQPTVVVAPAVTGFLLGPLAATALGVGFVAAHKAGDGRLPAGPLTWAQSPPDFRGRRVDLAVRDRHLGPGDRVLVVDDWVATAAQVRALYDICAARGAEPVGTSTIVTDCPPATATALRIHALLHTTQLG